MGSVNRKVAKNLEAIARSFRRASKVGFGSSPKSHLAGEIASLSERLDATREAHIDELRDLLRDECRIDTDLLALVSYRPKIHLYRGKERSNLKNKLLEIRREKRRLMRDHEKEVANLQDRLFRSLRQHQSLEGGDEQQVY